MTQEQLVELIRAKGARAVADAARNPALQLKEGWDLARWHAASKPGCIYFIHLEEDRDAIDASPRVMWVNAPERERPKWEEIARSADVPVTVLMREP
jgi:hypothetical protein